MKEFNEKEGCYIDDYGHGHLSKTYPIVDKYNKGVGVLHEEIFSDGRLPKYLAEITINPLTKEFSYGRKEFIGGHDVDFWLEEHNLSCTSYEVRIKERRPNESKKRL